MKNIKLKLGDVIHSYNGEHDDHVVQLCNLLLINKRGSYSQIEGFYCDVCKKAYAKNLQYLKRKFSNYQYDSPSEHLEFNEKEYSLKGKFITRLSDLNISGHDFRDIIALVPILTLNGEIISKRIPALLCESCYRFYILETEIKSLERCGKILCRVVTEEYWNSNDIKNAKFNLKSESILYQMGYNVNSQINLRYWERQRILLNVISNGILTKGEVLSHIDYLIKRSEDRMVLSKAIRKWKADRQFVANIDLDLQSYKVEEIRIRRHNV